MSEDKKALAKRINRKNLKQKLHNIYNDDVSLETSMTCVCSCCKIAMPQLNYSEFIQIITVLWDESKKEEKVALISRSIEYFFRNEFEKWGMDSLIKPCMHLDTETNLCTIYEDRPLSCFLPDTYVFSNKGPVKIKDILAGDLIYGNDGELHRVLGTHSKIYVGKIYNIKTHGNCFDNWCTVEHKWLVTKQKDKRKIPSPIWENAENLVPKFNKKEGHYLCYPASWNVSNFPQEMCVSSIIDLSNFVDGETVENRIEPYTSGVLFKGKNYHSIPKEVALDNEFFFMYGIYLAEGSVSQLGVSFTMNIKEKHHLDRISKYLNNSWGLQTHYNKIKKGKNVIILRVDSCLFGRVMKNIGGFLSYNKCIHPYFFQVLSPEELFVIFEAWHTGDGRKCFVEKEYSVTTTSKKLAAQMTMILFLNEIFPQVYQSNNTQRHDSFDVHIFPSNFRKCKKGNGTKRMYGDEYIYNPMFKKEEQNYNGPVFDIEVEDSESFVTMSGIAHNCRIYGLWPENEYNRRVDKFVGAYEEFGLTKEDLPLNKQCDQVKRLDESKPLNIEVIDGLYSKLDVLDKKIGDFSDAQITAKENYRTFHDWLLLKVFGEEWLSDLTTFMMAASKDDIENQIVALKEALNFYFKKKVPDIRENL